MGEAWPAEWQRCAVVHMTNVLGNLGAILVVVALGVALAGEIEDRGRSLYGWAIVLICLAVLWGVR